MLREHNESDNQQPTPSDFVRLVADKFQSHRGVFSEFRNVEDYIPEGTQLEQSLFLFYVVQLDYAVRGRVLYAGATKLHEEKADFFTPEHIEKLSDKELFKVLASYMKPRYPNEAVERYKQNSRKLQEDYSGNPMKIFSESKTAQIALDKIQDFRGMGPKTGNLFFRAMVSSFGIEYPDIESILQPVDIHDVRIAHLMGFIEKSDMTDRNIQEVKILWNRACLDAGVNWIIFDRALWLLGSEGKPNSKGDILKLLK